MDRDSGDFKEKCQQPKLSHSRVRERTKEMMTGEGGEPPPSFIGGVAPREQQATQVPRTGQARGSHSACSAQLGAPHTSHMWRERGGLGLCGFALRAASLTREVTARRTSVGRLPLSVRRRRRHHAHRRISSNDLSRTGPDGASST